MRRRCSSLSEPPAFRAEQYWFPPTVVLVGLWHFCSSKQREDAPCETLNVLCAQLSSLRSRFLSLQQRQRRPGVGMVTEDAATAPMHPASMVTHTIDRPSSIVPIIGEVSRMAGSTGHAYGVGTVGMDGAGVGGGGSPHGGVCCRHRLVL